MIKGLGVAVAVVSILGGGSSTPAARADVHWCSATGSLHSAGSELGGKLAVTTANGRRKLASPAFGGSVRKSPKKGKRRCVPRKSPVAVAMDGTPIWPGRRYAWLEKSGGNGRPVAIARDGFAIYGARIKDGEPPLDGCNGHASRVRTLDGSFRTVYHYHATAGDPFTVGCFNAPPSRDWAPITAPLLATPPPEIPGVAVDVSPEYGPSITDYVIRCDAGTPVSLQADFPAGSTSSRGSIRRMSIAPGQATTVSVPGSGVGRHVRCLPADFPVITTERFSQPQSAFYIFAPAVGGGSYMIIADDHGTPVWWYQDKDPVNPNPINANLLSNGDLAFSRQTGLGHASGPGSEYHELTLDGTLGRTISANPGPTDLHELEEMPNGDMLVLVYRPRAVDLTSYGGNSDSTVLDAEIQQVDPDGNIVWTWSSATHIGVDEGQPRFNPLNISTTAQRDLLHPNAVDYDPTTDQVLLSDRNADAIYMINHSDGSIAWKFGGTHTSKSLDVIGDPMGSQTNGAQHDARFNDATGMLTFHDNRSENPSSPLTPFFTDSTPRAVEFHIDTTNHTATWVEQVSDPVVTSSNCCGSARRLAGGDWVASWGGKPIIGEYSSSGVVLRMTIHGSFSYRAYPVAAGNSPGELDIVDLRAGMDAQAP